MKTRGSDRTSRWLRRFDAVILSSSGGKDSLAMIDRVAHLSEDAGVRDRLVVLHCDLGRAEWPGALETARAQAAHYGLRFEVRRRERGGLLDLVRERGRWPSAQAPYCRSYLKRDVARKFFTETARDVGAIGRPARLLSALGIRAAESPARARKPPLVPDRAASSGRREVTVWHPVLELPTDAVWRRVNASGAPMHPAYGCVSRLSCVLCPLASRADLLAAAHANPELAREYAAVEAEINHRFRADWSMARIITNARTAYGPALPSSPLAPAHLNRRTTG
jgi:3'-phosphoadenosine 5'-phosphosulfate sulfotransferase (PAPS reductase)/FAD synthetase